MPSTAHAAPDVEARLADLEARMATVEERTTVRPREPASIPGRASAPAPVEASAGISPAPASPPTTPPPAAPVPPRAARDLERLFGGQVLAWVGGVAVLAGLALLFALGISEGWIDPATRVALGAAVSTMLVGLGFWLHEGRGRTEAARAAVAAGCGGLFLAVTVASRAYEIVSPEVGLALAALAAAGTAAIALRWRSQVVGALGIAGALLAPVLADVAFGGATALFVLVAAVGATVVVLRERWTWLSFAVLAIPAIQWVPALMRDDGQTVAALAVLLAFGALNAAAALGVDLRARAMPLRTPAAYLLALNALLLALVGAFVLHGAGGQDAAAAWLLGLAAAHAVGGWVVRERARDLAILAFALAALVGNVAIVVLDLDPTVRILTWVASAVGLAVLARQRRALPDHLLACGLGGQLALAAIATLVDLRHGGAVADGPGTADAGVIVAVAALAAGCLVSGRLTAARPHWRTILDGAGFVAVALLGLLAFDGVTLTVAWAALAVATARVGRHADDDLARLASRLFLGGALLWAVGDQAPPSALLDGAVALGPATLGLGAICGAALAMAHGMREDDPERGVLVGVAATVGLYLASLAVVGVAPSSEAASGGSGQLALSALWALTGVVALVAGLRLHRRPVRLAALALLGLAIGKVFLFDLATLTAMARVGSFLALGVLLLLGAFAYQRLRPETANDNR